MNMSGYNMTLEEDAKALLETGDWVKDKMLQIYEDGTCGLCLVGALRFAFNNTWQWQAGLRTKTEILRSDAPNYNEYVDTCKKIASKIHEKNPEIHEEMLKMGVTSSKDPDNAEDILIRYNDHEDTSFQDILAILE